MSDGSLSVIAHVMSKAGCVEQVRAILSAIVEPTRREKGCISYHLLERGEHEENSCVSKNGRIPKLSKHIFQLLIFCPHSNSCQSWSLPNRIFVAIGS